MDNADEQQGLSRAHRMWDSDDTARLAVERPAHNPGDSPERPTMPFDSASDD